MKIECLIRRRRGSTVKMDDQVYTFLPEQEDGPHVAEVKNRTHVKRLLNIKSFCIPGNPPIAKAEKPAVEESNGEEQAEAEEPSAEDGDE